MNAPLSFNAHTDALITLLDRLSSPSSQTRVQGIEACLSFVREDYVGRLDHLSVTGLMEAARSTLGPMERTMVLRGLSALIEGCCRPEGLVGLLEPQMDLLVTSLASPWSELRAEAARLLGLMGAMGVGGCGPLKARLEQELEGPAQAALIGAVAQIGGERALEGLAIKGRAAAWSVSLERVVSWSLREPVDAAALDAPCPREAVRALLLDPGSFEVAAPPRGAEAPFALHPALRWVEERRALVEMLRLILALDAAEGLARDRAWAELHMALINQGQVARGDLAAPFLMELLEMGTGVDKADVLDLLGELLACCGAPHLLMRQLVGRSRVEHGADTRPVDERAWSRWGTWRAITRRTGALLELFVGGPEPRVRAVAAYPLRACPGEAVDAALWSAFEDERHPFVQAAALDALQARAARAQRHDDEGGALPAALTTEVLTSDRPRVVRWVALAAIPWGEVDAALLDAGVALLVDMLRDPLDDDAVRGFLPGFIYDGFDSANTPENLLCQLCCADAPEAVTRVLAHFDDPAAAASPALSGSPLDGGEGVFPLDGGDLGDDLGGAGGGFSLSDPDAGGGEGLVERLCEILARAFFGGVWTTEPQALDPGPAPAGPAPEGAARQLPRLLSPRQLHILKALARHDQPWGHYSEPGWLLRSLHLPTEPAALGTLLERRGDRLLPLPFWDDPRDEGSLNARLDESRRRVRLAQLSRGEQPGVRLTEVGVEAIERHLDCDLPEDLRRFLARVGNGGPGPGLGLMPLGERTWAEVPPRTLPDGARAIPLARYDDDTLALLVVEGFFEGTVWIEDRQRHGELLPFACRNDLHAQGRRRPIRRHCGFLEWWLHGLE